MMERSDFPRERQPNGFQSEYKLLIENSADGIVVVDPAGVTLFVNPAAEQIFGRPAADLVGAPIGIPIVTGDVTEVTLLRQGGSKIEAEMRVAGVRWRGGSALLVSLRDVTTRRIAEMRQRQSQRLEAIGQLTAGVAHDFNNILTAVLGNLQLIGSRATDDNIRRYARNGAEAAQRGARLTTQLLAFSRKQELNVRAIDLSRLVEDARDLLEQAVRDARVRLATLLDPNLWLASADPTQIELILLNLVINARDAMPSGGVIQIETCNIAAGDPRRAPEFSASEGVAFIVSDSGVGMTEEVKAKAFDPFFTTKDVGKGSGLGLSMVYGVVQQLGGTVRIESELGKGTRIMVCLSRAAADERAAEASLEERAAPPAIRERILVIDDDPQVLKTTTEMLQGFGYDVVASNDGRTAMRNLHRGEPFDLIVTDLSMPDFSGEQVISEAQRLHPQLPVLAVTGRLNIGLDPRIRVLRKPFSPAELAVRVRECLSER